MKKNVCNYLFMIFFAMSSSLFLSAQEEKSIEYHGVMIPVNPSERPLITGLDFDVMLREWIPDFGDFVARRSTYGGNRVRCTYRIPYPVGVNPFNPDDLNQLEDPERYQRVVTIDYGVFSSHREALKGGLSVLPRRASAIPPHIFAAKGVVCIDVNTVIRDNCYFHLTYSGKDIEPYMSAEKIDQWISDGGRGVYQEGVFPLPILEDSDKYKTAPIAIENLGTLPMTFRDPGKRSVYVYCHAETNSEHANPLKAFWDSDNERLRIEGSLGCEGTIRILAANDLGLFAEPVSLFFRVVEKGYASQSTLSAEASSLKTFQNYQ